MAGKEEIICLIVNLLVYICSWRHLFTEGCGFLDEAETLIFYFLGQERYKSLFEVLSK